MTGVLETKKNGREDQLQFLRFFAFMNVFTLHIGDWRIIEYPAWNGAVSAVTFFFMLSGALAGYNAYGRNIEVSLRAIGKDMWKKIRKIYPLYLVTTIYSAFHFGMPAEIVHNYDTLEETLIQFVRNLLMIQSWFPQGAFSFNGVSWYLSTLLFLYLWNLPMTAFLNKIGQKSNCNQIFFLLISVLVLATVGYSYITFTDDVHFLQYIFPPARIGQYLISMIIGYILHSLKGKIYNKSWNTCVYTIAEGLALSIWIVALFQPVETWYNRLVSWIIPNVFLIGIFLIGQGSLSKLFRFRPLVLLGDISFECYLIHEIIIYLLINVEPYTNWGRLICIGFVLGYTLLLAFLIHRKPQPMSK